jgi:hypothetical protein
MSLLPNIDNANTFASKFVSRLRTIYVGKHGNDANAGTTPADALLTIGAAITAASALTPAVNDEVLIDVTDAAVYTETGLTVPAYVQLDMDNASFTVTTGTGIIMSNNSYLVMATLTTSGTANGVEVVDGTATVIINTINHASSGDAIKANGASAATNVHLDANFIYVTGAGTGLTTVNTGGNQCSAFLEAGSMTVSGAGIGVEVVSTAGAVFGSVDAVVVTNAGGTGLKTLAGSSFIYLDTRVANAALGSIVDVAAGTEISIFSGTAVLGTVSGTGTFYRSDIREGNYIPNMLTGTTVVPANDEIRFFSASAGRAERLTISALQALISGETATKQSTNYTAAAGDFVLMSTGATDKTVTLPAAASNTDAVIVVKKYDAGAGNVIIDGNASETIDGDLTQTILSPLTSLTLHCDGTEWWIK